MTSVGKLSLIRFNGQEIIYDIVSATVESNYMMDYDDVVFSIETASNPQQKFAGTEWFQGPISAEFIARISDFRWELLDSRRIEIPKGYDRASKEYFTRLYYGEHLNPDNVVLNVARDGDKYRVRMSAECRDLNSYDGSKPNTKILLEALFDVM